MNQNINEPLRRNFLKNIFGAGIAGSLFLKNAPVNLFAKFTGNDNGTPVVKIHPSAVKRTGKG